MSKKVFKGWTDKTLMIEEIFSWYGYEDPECLTLEPYIMREKGKAVEWHPTAWPPNRVTVTVEVED